MRILVTLKVPSAVVQRMDTFKKKYFPAGFHKISSHVTLEAPFDLAGDFQEFVRDMGRLVKKIAPFTMAIEGIDVFHKKILFFKFSKPEGLLQLSQEISKEVDLKFKRTAHETSPEKREYQPHSTISISSPERIEKYKREIEPHAPTINFLVDGVCFYIWKRDHWHLEKELLFKNS